MRRCIWLLAMAPIVGVIGLCVGLANSQRGYGLKAVSAVKLPSPRFQMPPQADSGVDQAPNLPWSFDQRTDVQTEVPDDRPVVGFFPPRELTDNDAMPTPEKYPLWWFECRRDFQAIKVGMKISEVRKLFHLVASIPKKDFSDLGPHIGMGQDPGSGNEQTFTRIFAHPKYEYVRIVVEFTRLNSGKAIANPGSSAQVLKIYGPYILKTREQDDVKFGETDDGLFRVKDDDVGD